MRRVMIDPDETCGAYLGVIVQYHTGVEYQQQCAGVECKQRFVEGYYVPLGGAMSDLADGMVGAAELHHVFHRGVRVGCPHGGEAHGRPGGGSALPAERLEELRGVVARIPYWSEDGPEDERRVALRLDDGRLAEVREAWVPVVTPDGPGILIWPNCD